MPSSAFLNVAPSDTPRLDRALLKDQAADLLRDYITSGRIRPGSKLAERDAAELLGTSRMPVRDALLELGKEGLIVSRQSGRYVVELTEADIRRLFQVRTALECLAVELAAGHPSAANTEALNQSLVEMQRAIEAGDRSAYVKSDLAGHRLIWTRADNAYLLDMLNSITGPIMMFMASQTGLQEDWSETYEHHRDLIDRICVGDAEGARSSILMQMQYSLALSLQAFAAGASGH
jgi:DNA-binding GntR family transcriptional regulator